MPLINLIPMACLAAVLIVVSYNMSGWRTIRAIFHNPKSDISVLVLTFLLTVIFDLTIAIEMGLLLAVILFLRRVMENTEIKVYSEQLDIAEGSETTHHEMLNVNPGVEVYEIDGPFFFGVATKFDELMRTTIGEKPKVRIIRMRKVPFIDSTGIHNLEVLIKSSYDENIQWFFPACVRMCAQRLSTPVSIRSSAMTISATISQRLLKWPIDWLLPQLRLQPQSDKSL